MMRIIRTKKNDPPLPPHTNNSSGNGGGSSERKWELRPGGMWVQKRAVEEHHIPPPMIRVRVKYGSTHHEVRISPQATFGDLKKMLMGLTGLHHHDQKLYYKAREMDSGAFLDVVGIKDKSKIVLQEDPLSREKRYIEMKKSAKLEKAAKLLSEITLEVDGLAEKVSAVESVITKGEKVDEKDIMNLIDLLMNQVVKLDGVTGDGDLKLPKEMQAKRVQKYVETLDVLKVKASSPPALPPQKPTNRSLNHRSLIDELPIQQDHVWSQSTSNHNPFVTTTQWETALDSVSSEITNKAAPSTFSIETSMARSGQPSFTWNLL